MAGIYIHIPFCKSRCIYCDFYSTTALKKREWYIAHLSEEIVRRRNYLGYSEYTTIYIGGGTPSQLSHEQLETLVKKLRSSFQIADDAEFTIEVNPDDVTPELTRHLMSLGVNRVSMGIQTFDDNRLRFLRRRHSSDQALEAVKRLKDAGLTNISIDLMFGFPGEKLNEWIEDVEKALSLDVRHISAYSLMYEEGTALTKMIEYGGLKEIDDELSAEMYSLLMDKMQGAGFEHYEISNFCKPGFHSRHNSSYWEGIPYIGLGAGAHSFDGRRRQWNGRMDSDGWRIEGEEVLTEAQVFNEKIMTGLRTSKGVNLKEIESRFPHYFKVIEKDIEKYISMGKMQICSNLDNIRLTRDGIYVSNDIMSDLMITE